MTTIMERMKALMATVESLMADVEKFEQKGNNAAGTRVTTGMMSVKNQAAEIRKAVFAAKKS